MSVQPDQSSRAKRMGAVVRALPRRMRGKARLARLLLGPAKASAALVQDRDGNTLLVPSLEEPVGFGLWMDGEYEPEVLAFLKHSVRPHSTFIDVGANIGALAIPMARCLSQGRVLAIEASPVVAKVLRDNVARNHAANITVIECAASTGEDTAAEFYEAPIDHFGMGSSAPQFGSRPIQVPARAIDDLLIEWSVTDVDVMKVDVEGYEADVFRGARRLLTSPRAPRIVFEFCDWAEARAFDGRCGGAQEILLQWGYRIWTLPDFVRQRAPLTAPLREGFQSLVAVKDARP